MLTLLGNSIVLLFKEKKIFFCTILINLIVSLIKNIVYVYIGQLIFLTTLRIILVMANCYDNML